jgi:hypothetical protein
MEKRLAISPPAGRRLDQNESDAELSGQVLGSTCIR